MDQTVADFAKKFKIPVEELLQKMEGTNLQGKSADATLSLEDKKLLIKALGGARSTAAPVARKLAGSGKHRVTVRKIGRQPRAASKPAADAVAAPAVAAAPQEAAAPAPEAPPSVELAQPAETAPAEAAAKTARQKKPAPMAEQAAVAPAPAAAQQPEARTPPAGEDRPRARPGRAGAAPERRGARPGAVEEPRSRTRKGTLETKWKSPLSMGENYQRILEEALEKEAAQQRQPDAGTQRLVLSKENKHAFRKPGQHTRRVRIGKKISLYELADQLSLKKELVIRAFADEGMKVDENSAIDQEFAAVIVEKLGHTPLLEATLSAKDRILGELEKEADSQPRPPVVVVMGHVDHGKTTLLDYLRKSETAAQEEGGITQHIGAYRVQNKGQEITFLDTPGHAAFSAMRARGAQVTDIVILVVAADDGIKPQTEEALQHIQSAGVPVIVAVNKMDKPGANFEKVEKDLSARGLVPEKWGGDVQYVPISALSGDGVDALLEAILLQAELLDLRASLKGLARGVIIESRLDRGRGPIMTLLVQQGCLKKGAILVLGDSSGRVRMMLDEHGEQVPAATPSMPVEVQGINKVMDVGLSFLAVPTEKLAREWLSAEAEEAEEEAEAGARAAAEEEAAAAAEEEEEGDDEDSDILRLFDQIAEDSKKTVHLVVKADVKGSLEALLQALPQLESEEVKLRISSSGIGAITETDVNLALATDAMIIGFNVRADAAATRAVEANGVQLRYYGVIYKLLDDVQEVVQGLATPEVREKMVGLAEVRETFKSPKFGMVAGCFVEQGAVRRALPVRVLRDGVVIHEGKLSSLRRFKDDVNEVSQGTECGIGVRNYNNVRVGDRIEVFEEVA